ncbi:MAG: FprA family A-type flavoprotein [Clostridia bacterium]|nr:FprA family A-type flavoprotein [Clostridia bacterium]
MKVSIAENVRYIGVDDKTIDLFESQYDVPNGISYNSYVILDDKVCVMDTVDARFTEEWMENLKWELEGRAPDYLVISHMEPDHAASIGALCAEYPEMKLVLNEKTIKLLGQFFEGDYSDRFVVVAEGESLSLGEHTLSFYMAPMVHWPEVMVTYEAKDKILFSADGFGKFGALDTDEDWTCEARRYYFNIVGKYGAQVQALLKKAAGLDIEIICPLHGPVLKEDLGYYIGKYDTWSSYRPEDKGVFVVCASIHGNTKKAALLLCDMLRERGEKVSFCDIARDDMAEAVEDAFRYDRTVFCAASYDGGVFAPMADFLTHLKSKTFRERRAYIVENGSWGPTAAKAVKASLAEMKDIDVCDTVVTIRSSVKEADVAALEALAEVIVNDAK